jgi:hypothetical protein
MAPVDYKAKIREARQNGYTDAEIIKYLAATDPKVKEAVDSGYKPTEIIKFISPPKKAAPRNRGTGIGAIDTTLDVINEALIGVPEGAYNAAAMITDPISSLIFGKDVVKQAQNQRKKAVDTVARQLTTQPRPVAREVGRMVGPVAGVTRAANLAAPILQKAPVVGNALARIAKATASGGVGSGRTAAQSAKLTRLQRAKQLGERAVGGGISGAATAGLMDQDVLEGGAYGAGLPVVLNVLKRMGSPVVDFFRPGFTMAKGKAAEILRRAFADNLDAARAEFAKLSPDDQRMAEQFLVDVKIEPRAVFGIGKMAQEQTETGADVFGRKLKSDTEARTRRLAEAAGGDTMEDIRAAVRGERAAATQAVAPLREEMYRRAGYANEFVPAKLGEAADLEKLAAQKSGVNRRMILGAGRAEKRIGETEDFYSRIGDEFRPEMVSEDRGISGAMTQRGEKAGLTAITARERAGDIFDEVDSLAAEGIRPMRAADLISSLQRKMADPEILRGSVEEGAIKGVIRQLEKATDANGMLNPKALGKIRRSGINNIVNRLSTQMGGVPSRTGTPEAAQGTVLELRSLIDDTLRRGGGGDLVDEFLQKSEQGYAAVNRQQLAGEAFRRYETAPETGAEFLKLVRGGDPKAVGKIMGGGPENEKIANAFAGDPRRLDALKMTADELTRLNTINTLRGEGTGAAGKVILNETPSYITRGFGYLMNTPAAPIAVAAEGARRAQTGYLMPRVEKELVDAYASAPRMGELIDTFPARQIASEKVSQVPAGVRNVMAQQFGPPPTIGSEFGFPEFDPESGDPLIDIDFSEGYPAPIYGRVSSGQFQNLNKMRR